MSRGVFLKLKLETEVWNEEQRTRRVLYYRVLLPGALTTCQCMSCVLHTHSGVPKEQINSSEIFICKNNLKHGYLCTVVVVVLRTTTVHSCTPVLYWIQYSYTCTCSTWMYTGCARHTVPVWYTYIMCTRRWCYTTVVWSMNVYHTFVMECT